MRNLTPQMPTIVVVCNEAGDADSMVSALVYAWYLHRTNPSNKYVAFTQCSEASIRLDGSLSITITPQKDSPSCFRTRSNRPPSNRVRGFPQHGCDSDYGMHLFDYCRHCLCESLSRVCLDAAERYSSRHWESESCVWRAQEVS
jgi:hypothetical protein